MPTTSNQQSRPSTDQRFLTGQSIGFLNPGVSGEDLGIKNKFTQAGVAAVPGSILPDYQGLLDTAGQSFFGGFSQGEDGQFLNDNAVFSTALNNVFAGPPGGFGGGGGGATGGTATAGIIGDAARAFEGPQPQIVGEDRVGRALDFLENPPSVFDQATGGPIADRINELNASFGDALTDKAMADLDEATEIALSNDLAGGLLSGSTMLMHREKLANNVLLDLNALLAGVSLDNTKFLFDMAMQDLAMQSNNMQQILAQAMIEKGIDTNEAIATADRVSREAIAQAELITNASIATAGNQTAASVANAANALTARGQDFQFASGSADRNLSLLGLGLNDQQNTTGNLLDIGTLPLDVLLGTGGGQASSGSSFSL